MEVLALVAPTEMLNLGMLLFLLERLFSSKIFEQGPACYFKLNQGLHHPSIPPSAHL